MVLTRHEGSVERVTRGAVKPRIGETSDRACSSRLGAAGSSFSAHGPQAPGDARHAWALKLTGIEAKHGHQSPAGAEFYGVTPPQVADEAMLNTALPLRRRYRLSFGDCPISAAAIQANCDTLLTEDQQHGQRRVGRLLVRNPPTCK